MNWFTYLFYHSSYKCVWISIIPSGRSLLNSELDLIISITSFTVIFIGLLILKVLWNQWSYCRGIVPGMGGRDDNYDDDRSVGGSSHG
jgi:hypothetical protein